MRSIWKMGTPTRSSLIAVVLVGADVMLFSRITEDPKYTSWVTYPVNSIVVVLASVPAVPLLIWRRRAPVIAFLVLTVHDLLLTCVLGTRPVLTPMAALYTVSSRRELRTTLDCLAAALAVHGLAVAYEVYPLTPAERPLDSLLIATFLTFCDAAAVLVGRWAANSRIRERHLIAERSVAVEAERLRIARELHDIVAHAVTVMVLQSAGARRAMATEPARAQKAMQAVEDVGVQAMAELRRMLNVLRPVQGAVDNTSIDRAPRLSMLTDLVEQVRTTGVAVQVDSSGRPAPLDHSVDTTAYRVIQEALTNVTRHSGPGSSACVRLRWSGTALEIVVTDDGAGTPLSRAKDMSSGLGLVGLRERVTVIGGSMASKSLAEGGYQLTAILPVTTQAGP